MTDFPKDLGAPAPRKPLHTRQVRCQGYVRDDGLFDIEGEITDTKAYDFANHSRGTVAAGEPIHHMRVRITVDEDLRIVAAEAVSIDTPYTLCKAAAPNFARLAGIRIGPGYMRKVKERYGRDQGCTHILELLYPLGTTAYQTVFPYREYQRRLAGVTEGDSMQGGPPLNSCYSFSSRRSVVQELWPDRYEGPEVAEDDGDGGAAGDGPEKAADAA
jgi:hypothetical protein